MARSLFNRGSEVWAVRSGLMLVLGALVASACGDTGGNGSNSGGGGEDAAGSGTDVAGTGGKGSGGTVAQAGNGGTMTNAATGGMPDAGTGGIGEPGSAGQSGHTSVDPIAGGGGEGGVPSTPTLTIIATTPQDAAVSVEPDGNLTVQFSAPLNAESVTGASVELRDVFLDRAVPAELAVAGDTITINPSGRLGLVAGYELTIEASVSDMDGVSLAEDNSFSFTVRDGTWHEQPLATGTITYLSHNLGLDDAGTTFISWVQRTVSGYCPTTAKRIPLLGNADAAAILTTTTYESDCRSPRTAAAGAGFGATTWDEDAGIYVSQHRGQGWVNAPTTMSDASPFDHTNIAVLPDGTVHLVARKFNSMIARHTDATGQWAAVTDVLTADRPRSNPALAFDAQGNGFAAWRSRDAGLNEMILVSSFSKQAGVWTAATTLPGSLAPQPGVTYYRGTPALALNATGEAMLVWVRGSAEGTELYGSRYASSAWQTPVPISTVKGGLVFQEEPGLVAVGNDFVVAWNQTVSAVNNTYTARFSQGAWSAPDLRSGGTINGLKRMPRLDVDDRQNLLLVWPRATETLHVYDYVQARFLQATNTWYGPTTVTQVTDKNIDFSPEDNDFTTPGYTVALPFAVNGSGVAALAWASRPISVTFVLPQDPMLTVFH
jgi:hypothetical protein